jgi:hypothetical protein
VAIAGFMIGCDLLERRSLHGWSDSRKGSRDVKRDFGLSRCRPVFLVCLVSDGIDRIGQRDRTDNGLKPALLMTVRGEIAKPRCETGAQSQEDLRRTHAVRRRSEGRARRPQACRNSGSAVAVEES